MNSAYSLLHATRQRCARFPPPDALLRVIDAQRRLSSHAPSAGLSSHETYLDDEEYERAALDSLAAQVPHPAHLHTLNWLRNQAIGCVATSHYLIADIDFWPSRELRRLIRMQLPAWGEAQRALVVPNFQRSGHGCRASGPSACRDAFERGSLGVPSNYSELATCARARQCAVFDSEYNAAAVADFGSTRRSSGGSSRLGTV